MSLFVEPFEHQPCHRKIDHHFAAPRQELIILGQKPTLAQPDKGAFDNPATWQHLNAATVLQPGPHFHDGCAFALTLACDGPGFFLLFFGRGALNDFQAPAQLVLHPVTKITAVALISPHDLQPWKLGL